MSLTKVQGGMIGDSPTLITPTLSGITTASIITSPAATPLVLQSAGANAVNINASGAVQTYNNIGSNITNSFGGPYPVMLMCAKNGTPNITFTVNYYQNGQSWEPMHYKLEVTSTQGGLTGNQTAWWLINCTHYSASVTNSVSASGGNTAGYALSYSNSGTGTSGSINTNTITITPNGSQNYSTALLQVVNYGGVGSIT